MFRRFSSIAVSKARNVSTSTTGDMMFRRFSSIKARNVSTPTTVVNVISKFIQDLSKKSDLILQMRKRLRGVKTLNLVQQEFLQSQPRVVHQLDFLQKLYKEIVPPAGQLIHTDAPITTPTTHSDSAPLSIISKHFQDLHQKLAIISKTEEQLLCQGMSIDHNIHNIMISKSCVVHQFTVLKKVLEEIPCEIEFPSPGGGVFENELKNLLMPKSKELPWICTSDHSLESMQQGPLDKHRYLLVSNGCEIHCLDLKQSKHQSMTHDVPLLPIIATLDFLDEDLPTTVGLFKWRSKVYMIGGQKLPRDLYNGHCHGLSLYNDLCRLHRVKPTSCLINSLSLDDCKTSLSHSESNILELQKPKIWPIVEEMNGEIHVIDSFPFRLQRYRDHEWTGSHEVFNRDNGCLLEEVVPPEVDEKFSIRSYLVVGNKIYAKAFGNRTMVFDSRKNKWHLSSNTEEWGNSHFLQHATRAISEVVREDGKARGPSFKDVSGMLNCAAVCSVGGFPYGDAQDPLHVVIALETDIDCTVLYRTRAVAFLVNSSGQILCIQSLKRFFKAPLCYMFQGKIIKVEDDKLGKKKTMCSIVIGCELEWEVCNDYRRYVLINTFSVEELPDSADEVRQVLAKGSEAWPVEMEFVCVDVMDRYVYKTDAELDGGGDSTDWIGIQACFL